jgi:MFS family permease
MYLGTRPTVEASRPSEAEDRGGVAATTRLRNVPRVSRNVVMLGLTSMFTDISTEMVASVLPLLFVVQLGFSPFQFGAVDGVYQGMAAVICVLAAVSADRRQRHKRVAGAGYGLSTGATLILVVASGSWIPVLGSIYLDRLGKGIRTAPRDALISLSSARDRLATSFGVHRAFDTLGAVIGPLLAALLLAANPSGFDVVFVVSFFIGVIGLAVFLFFVEERRERGVQAPPRTRRSVAAAALVLLRERQFRRIWLLAVGFALLTPGDAMLYLALERRVDLPAGYFPLLYFGTSVVFLLAAIPCGRLADKIGPLRVFIGGEVLLVGAFASVGSRTTGLGMILATLILLGGFYAATDGVLMALISPMIPGDLRTSGMGLVIGAVAVGHLVASIAFGAAWAAMGPATAVHLFMVGLVVMVVIGARMLRDQPRILTA